MSGRRFFPVRIADDIMVVEKKGSALLSSVGTAPLWLSSDNAFPSGFMLLFSLISTIIRTSGA